MLVWALVNIAMLNVKTSTSWTEESRPLWNHCRPLSSRTTIAHLPESFVITTRIGLFSSPVLWRILLTLTCLTLPLQNKRPVKMLLSSITPRGRCCHCVCACHARHHLLMGKLFLLPFPRRRLLSHVQFSKVLTCSSSWGGLHFGNIGYTWPVFAYISHFKDIVEVSLFEVGFFSPAIHWTRC